MNLNLNSTTKEAFLAIDSSAGLANLNKLYQHFKEYPSPVKLEDFAGIMEIDVDDALKLAQNKGELNDRGEIVGLLGFSIVSTNHELIIEGRKFYTWCAADTLIFPSIFKVDAVIHSTDPINNVTVEIKVSGDIITEISPGTAMISWIDDIDKDDIRCSMCNRVHFFATAETAAKWHENNQDARILSVADYYTNGIKATD